ncbi:MAG: hypothetical protein ABI193_01765 [Minicystis sp.]
MKDEPHALMNELLPAPTGPFGNASPRSRTLAKMERLLSLAATSAAIGGCTNGGTPTQPIVDIPPVGSAGPAVIAGTNTAPPPIKTAPTADLQPEPSIGYAVVDPLPPPAVCAGVSPTVQATATWRQDKAGLIIEIALGKPGFAGSSYVVGSPPSVYGGKIIHTKIAADSVLIRVEPTPGTGSVDLSVAVHCAAGQSHLGMNIQVAAAGKAGATLGTSLYDHW